MHAHQARPKGHGPRQKTSTNHLKSWYQSSSPPPPKKGSDIEIFGNWKHGCMPPGPPARRRRHLRDVCPPRPPAAKNEGTMGVILKTPPRPEEE